MNVQLIIDLLSSDKSTAIETWSNWDSSEIDRRNKKIAFKDFCFGFIIEYFTII